VRPTPTQLLALLVLIATGCAGKRPLALETEPPLEPIEPRIYAVLGEDLVIPVRFSDALSPARDPNARLDDGRDLDATVHWISIDLAQASRAWLPDPGRWRSTPATAGSIPDRDGFWAVKLTPPLNAFGQGVWLWNRRIDLDWVPSGASLEPPRDAWATTAPEAARQSAYFRLLAQPESINPMLRWRHRLAMDRLAEAELHTPPFADDRFTDPVLEAFARQHEARWAHALARLRIDNERLAYEVRRRLTLVTEIAGQPAPTWPIIPASLDTLLSVLINPDLEAAARDERVQAWLDEQPTFVAWAHDDAGRSDAITGETISTIGATNLLGADRVVSITREGAALAGFGLPDPAGAEPPERVIMRRIPRIGSALIEIESHEFDADDVLLIESAGRQAVAQVLGEPAPAAPPGFRINALMPERSLVEWMAGLPGTPLDPASPGGTAALFYRGAYSDPQPVNYSGRDEWAIFIECSIAPTGDIDPGERVRVWLGPRGAPLAVYSVYPDGRVIDERIRKAGEISESSRVIVTRGDDRWSCQIPIPARCVEGSGIVRLGLERISPQGRSSWPRPMFPWQVEPARLAIDTTTWGSLSGR